MIQFSDETLAGKFMEMAENVATIKTKLEDLPELKKTVEKHEKVYTVGKYAAVPVLTAFHVTIRSVLTKLGL
jgi:hypothetical protein